MKRREAFRKEMKKRNGVERRTDYYDIGLLENNDRIIYDERSMDGEAGGA